MLKGWVGSLGNCPPNFLAKNKVLLGSSGAPHYYMPVLHAHPATYTPVNSMLQMLCAIGITVEPRLL